MDNEEYKKVLNYQINLCKTKDDIVAGFPWFGAWGRDTMISLPAYFNDLDFTVSVLKKYGQQIQNGLLPNLISESGIGTNYMTVDASLWFCLRVYQVFENIKKVDKEILLSYVVQIITNYYSGKDLPFGCDKNDYLINIPFEKGKAYTWMDAIVHGDAVTPRCGKPVEINGLWFNAMLGFKHMIEEVSDGEKIFNKNKVKDSFELKELRKILAILSDSMKKFYVNGTWVDRIEDGNPIFEIRPNYMIALSLPFDFEDEDSLRVGFETAKYKLLTDFGLRTLDPESPMFRKSYIGKQKTRDLAYHQGTVWYWLLYYYCLTGIKVIKESSLIKEELNKTINPLKEMIRKGCWYSAAEVWDGENPTAPKGAPCQAWSVAALYLIEKELEKLK